MTPEERRRRVQCLVNLEKQGIKAEPEYDSEQRRMQTEEIEPSYVTMLAAEPVLRRDWDLPEEDLAWSDL